MVRTARDPDGLRELYDRVLPGDMELADDDPPAEAEDPEADG